MQFQHSILFHSDPFRPIVGRDLYELSEFFACQLSEALAIIRQEGWFMTGYNDAGQESFVSPAEEEAARLRFGEPD